MDKRASGILLHVTSLPSNFGIGDLGPCAFNFADLLSEIRQSYWQILPLTPTSFESGNSPYIGSSGFAGNTLLISPELLVEEKLLRDSALCRYSLPFPDRVDFEAVIAFKKQVIVKAYESFRKNYSDYISEFETFCAENSSWLDDYALYKALKEKNYRPWYFWQSDLRNRKRAALVEEMRRLKDPVELEKFAQFIFFKQWDSLWEYCRFKGLKIIGDVPFYLGFDSADVWVNPEVFKLDNEKRPAFVAGVPPDYFSETGQLWGNPVYDWKQLESTNFKWWMDRLKHNLNLFDLLRLDHFRGFLAFWEVPANADVASKGKWVKTPSEAFFKTLAGHFPTMPFLAEDLGFITDDVTKAMNDFNIPGMKVLLFGFNGDPDNPHLIHNHTQNSISLTGTHDTNTIRGWFVEEAKPEELDMLFKYAGRKLSEEDVSAEMIKLVLMSVANLSIIPMQDVLSLGSSARMNFPATALNNWEWRVTEGQLKDNMLKSFREMIEIYGRCRQNL